MWQMTSIREAFFYEITKNCQKIFELKIYTNVWFFQEKSYYLLLEAYLSNIYDRENLLLRKIARSY